MLKKPLLRKSFLQEEILSSCKKNNKNRISCLLSVNADIETTDKIGNSLLHISVLNKNYDMVNFLLKNKANINKRGNLSTGDTALMMAFKNKDRDIINLLLKNNADAMAYNYEGINSLLYCLINNRYYLFNTLIDYGGKINLKYKRLNYDTVLLYSVLHKPLNIIKYLVNKSADVNIANNDNISPLINSVKRNDIKITKYLLKNDSDVYHKDCELQTAFFNSILYSDFKIIIKI
jgi:ankyrin repeat protein